MLKYFLLWFPMLIIAILNGAIRDLWYTKITGELSGHQISTILLIIFFGIYISFVIRNYPPQSGMQALLVGVFWLVVTLLFEFGFGLYRGNSWTKLLADYNILKGRLWMLVPIWITLAPYLAYRFFSR